MLNLIPSARTMVPGETIDVFPFFNELDLLDLRLAELDTVVDRFVLVEGTKTFQGADKPLHFQQNKDRYARYLHKITHIVVRNWPGPLSYWHKLRKPRPMDLDNYMKDQAYRGLTACRPNDVIIISDLDEIPRPELIETWRVMPGYKVFEQRMYYYYLNCLCTHIKTDGRADGAQHNHDGLGWWRGPVMLYFKDFRSFRQARRHRDKITTMTTVLPDAGWHFSYQGGADMIRQKLSSYAHPEHMDQDLLEAGNLERIIAEGRSLVDTDTRFIAQPLDRTYPKTLLAQPERFFKMLAPGTEVVYQS